MSQNRHKEQNHQNWMIDIKFYVHLSEWYNQDDRL